MPTPEEEAQALIENFNFTVTYRRAIEDLRKLGLERILRRLGEPKTPRQDNPMAMQILALETAERKGWYDAINYFFNFPDVITDILHAAPPELDFGAEEKLKTMGLT